MDHYYSRVLHDKLSTYSVLVMLMRSSRRDSFRLMDYDTRLVGTEQSAPDSIGQLVPLSFLWACSLQGNHPCRAPVAIFSAASNIECLNNGRQVQHLGTRAACGKEERKGYQEAS